MSVLSASAARDFVLPVGGFPPDSPWPDTKGDERLHSYFRFDLRRSTVFGRVARAELRLRINPELVVGPCAAAVRRMSVYATPPEGRDLIELLRRGGLRTSTENNYTAYLLERALFRVDLEQLHGKMRIVVPSHVVRCIEEAVAGEALYFGITLRIATSACGGAPDFGAFGLRRLALRTDDNVCVAIAPDRRVDHHQAALTQAA